MHTILPLLLAWHANAAIQLGYESAKRVQYLSCPLPSSSFSSLLSLTRGTHLYVVFNLRPTALLQYTGQYPCLSSPSSARPGRRAQDFRRPSIWTPIVADHRFSCGHRACSEGRPPRGRSHGRWGARSTHRNPIGRRSGQHRGQRHFTLAASPNCRC
jgi:hypothetical protein